MAAHITGTVEKYMLGSKERWMYWFHVPKEIMPGQYDRGFIRRRGFPTKTLALTKMEDHISRIKGGGISVSTSMTVAELCEAWLDELRADPETEDRAANYERTVTSYLLPYYGRDKIQAVPEKLQGHYKVLSARGGHRECCWRRKRNPRTCQKGKPLKASTVKTIHMTISALYTWAAAKRLFGKNPIPRIVLPRVIDKPFVIWDTKTATRAMKLFATERLGIAFMLALCCGMRNGEITGLRWSSVDLENGVLSIDNQITHAGSKSNIEKLPKYRKTRTIIIPDVVVTMFQIHRARQEVEEARKGWSAEYVVTNRRGEPYAAGYLNVAWQTALARHDLPLTTLHGGRHLAATLRAIAGLSQNLLQHFLGHADGRTTARYVHATHEGAQVAANSFNQLFPAPSPTADDQEGDTAVPT